MGRHKKVIENGLEIESDEIEVDGEEGQTVDEPIADENVKRAYVKNGVTIMRLPAEEKDLLGQGWKRK